MPINKKRYFYKVYTKDLIFITTWSADVISNPSFRTVLNGGAGELVVRLGRAFNNFGEGVDVAVGNRVELYVSDVDTPYVQKLYAGYISQYAPTVDDAQQYVTVTLLGYVAEASYRVLKDTSGNTTVTYTARDPSNILKDIIDKYRSDGGTNLNYNSTSIDLTGTSVTYTFKLKTLQECFQTIVELCPVDWYWFLDVDGLVHLHRSNTTLADHTATIGRDIKYMQAINRIENLTNRVFVEGDDTVPIFNRYDRSVSQSTYGIHESVVVDSLVTDNTASDAMAKRALDINDSPEVRTIVHIIDNDGEDVTPLVGYWDVSSWDTGYWFNRVGTNTGLDIESFQVGDTLQIKNLKFGSSSSVLWDINKWDVATWGGNIVYSPADIVIIQSITYYSTYIEIECSSRLPEISKRVENVAQDLQAQSVSGVGTTPSVRTV